MIHNSKEKNSILVPKIETQPIIQQLKDKNNTTGFLINKIAPEHNGEKSSFKIIRSKYTQNVCY